MNPFDQFDNTVSHRQEAPQIASEPVQEAQDGSAGISLPTGTY